MLVQSSKKKPILPAAKAILCSSNAFGAYHANPGFHSETTMRQYRRITTAALRKLGLCRKECFGPKELWTCLVHTCPYILKATNRTFMINALLETSVWMRSHSFSYYNSTASRRISSWYPTTARATSIWLRAQSLLSRVWDCSA